MTPLEWNPRSDTSVGAELKQLIETAAAAIQREDELIRVRIAAALESGDAAKKRAFSNVGQGVSYWLYETTLVYFIWSAWAATGKAAALDWNIRGIEGETGAPHERAAQSVDLGIFSDASQA